MTARDLWNCQRQPDIRWGMVYPVYTNLAVIALIYCVVTPLILVVIVFAFTSLYAAQRYNLCKSNSGSFDTGGMV